MKVSALIAISSLFALAGTGKSVVLARETAESVSLQKNLSQIQNTDLQNKKENKIEELTTKKTLKDGKQVAPHSTEVIPHQETPLLQKIVSEDANSATLAVLLKSKIRKNDELTKQLEDRKLLLAKVEERVNEKLNELEQAQNKLSDSLARLDRASSDEISSLVKMYQLMKPSQAGAIFNAMDPKFAAGFLTKMKSENAALILANMETEKAYAISIIIAGNASAGINKI